VVNTIILSLTALVNYFWEGEMISKFMNLDPAKRERILNAASEEFAQKGYQNASTNEIVKKAGISKGLLFHYFENKQNLFLFLLAYSQQIFMDDFYGKFDFTETDLIKKCRQLSVMKIEMVQKNPELYHFLLASMTDESIDAQIKKERDAKNNNILSDAYKRIFANIDTSVFKEGIDVRRITEIIIWVMQGFGNKELENLRQSENKLDFDLKAVMEDYDGYIELLKNAFYNTDSK